MFDRIADITWRHPRAVLGGVAGFFALSVALGIGVEEHLQPAGFSDPTSESKLATEALRDELGYDASPGIVAVLEEHDGSRINFASKDVRNEARRLSNELRKARHVGRVINPLVQVSKAIDEAELARSEQERLLEEAAAAAAAAQAAGLPPDLPQPASGAPAEIPTNYEIAKDARKRSPLIAKDGRSMLLSVHLSTDDPEAEGGESADDIGSLVSSDRFKVGLSGFAVAFNEVETQAREDLTKAEKIAFPILAVLLLLVFRSFVAASIPLLVGVVSVFGTFMALRVLSEFTDVSLFALNITTALSLGLAVDYGLLMVSRYREELERSGATREAHARTISTAGRTVLFSGITVASALFALVLFPQRFLYSVGVAGAAVGLLASMISILAVGALLSILGERINSLSIRKVGPSNDSDAWHRLARGVMKRPVRVALISSAVLIALAVPLAFTELTGPSSEAVPPSKPSFAVTQYIEDHYPGEVVEPTTLTVRGDITDSELRRYSDRVLRVDGVADGGRFVSESKGFHYATFSLVDKPTVARSQTAVETIRDLPVPGGAEMLASGNAAEFLDQKTSMVEHAPRVIIVVTLITLLILFLLTGSIILPIKTLLMNFLTMGATLGIVVLAFQEGLLDGPLNYTGPPAVELMTLLLVFAVAFGLATDYAVLVMARIKENHDRGMSNEDAVVEGIARTGRVISAAAVMLAVVFIAFAVSAIFFLKQAAIGQAAAVLIDATIVRALLVPSLMKLFGEANWWAPGPLKRFQERFGFTEG